MDKTRAYLGSRMGIATLILAIIVIFGLSIWLLNVPLQVFWLGLQASLFLVIIAIGIDFTYFNKQVQIQSDLAQKIAKISSLEQTMQNQQADLQEYFMLWVHQMKTPITAAKLLSTSEFGDATENLEKIRFELIRIEDYSNMALNYLKITDDQMTLDISEVTLDAVLRPLLKRYAPLFINARVQLVYEPIQASILSDAQWLSIMLEQILNNAIKYTSNGVITVTFNQATRALTIQDTGIGIHSEDLPRIFERGYSGFNGRLNQKSTGLGLFLVKNISKRLGHGISVESKVQEGTCFTIQFT